MKLYACKLYVNHFAAVIRQRSWQIKFINVSRKRDDTLWHSYMIIEARATR